MHDMIFHTYNVATTIAFLGYIYLLHTYYMPTTCLLHAQYYESKRIK